MKILYGAGNHHEMQDNNRHSDIHYEVVPWADNHGRFHIFVFITLISIIIGSPIYKDKPKKKLFVFLLIFNMLLKIPLGDLCGFAINQATDGITGEEPVFTSGTPVHSLNGQKLGLIGPKLAGLSMFQGSTKGPKSSILPLLGEFWSHVIIFEPFRSKIETIAQSAFGQSALQRETCFFVVT